MNKILLVLLAAFASHRVYSQASDTTLHTISINAAGNANKTNGGDSYILNNGLKLSIQRKESIALNFNNVWLYGRNDSRLTNNDYAATFDVNLYRHIRGFYYWGLANYTTSYSLKIVNQLQTGAGIAYNIIKTPDSQLNISDGILFETSSIRPSVHVTEDYQTFRNSLRLTFKYTFAKKITADGTGFLQNSLNYKNDYIIRANAGIGFKINDWLMLNTALRYNKLERTKRENLLLSYGIRAEKSF